MPVLVVIVVAAVIVVLTIMLRKRRRPPQDAGIQSFRRHIDALSPEARREVIERARRHDEDHN